MLSKRVVFFVPLLLLFTFLMYYLDGDYSVPQEEKPKYILYWTPMFQRSDFYLGLGNIFQNCPIKKCFATDQKDLIDVDKFDAILFHGPEYKFNKHGVPENRSQNQIYIYSNQESPLNTKHHQKFHQFFNWTMTYRLSSDIVRSYGFIKQQKTNYKPPTPKDITRRTNKIAWFVSHCSTESAREVLAQKINKHLPVHIYGQCGPHKCDRKNEKKCYEMLENNYKFYLAFENSICQDYVTEKLYNTLQLNIVPIVYGGANYEKLAPPKSVIDASKFTKISDLAAYLKRLDENATEYLEYFEWKRDYVIDSSNKNVLCSLCEKLHQPKVAKFYEDIDKWWGRDQCNEIPDLLNTN